MIFVYVRRKEHLDRKLKRLFVLEISETVSMLIDRGVIDLVCGKTSHCVIQGILSGYACRCPRIGDDVWNARICR